MFIGVSKGDSLANERHHFVEFPFNFATLYLQLMYRHRASISRLGVDTGQRNGDETYILTIKRSAWRRLGSGSKTIQPMDNCQKRAGKRRRECAVRANPTVLSADQWEEWQNLAVKFRWKGGSVGTTSTALIYSVRFVSWMSCNNRLTHFTQRVRYLQTDVDLGPIFLCQRLATVHFHSVNFINEKQQPHVACYSVLAKIVNWVAAERSFLLHIIYDFIDCVSCQASEQRRLRSSKRKYWKYVTSASAFLSLNDVTLHLRVIVLWTMSAVHVDFCSHGISGGRQARWGNSSVEFFFLS